MGNSGRQRQRLACDGFAPKREPWPQGVRPMVKRNVRFTIGGARRGRLRRPPAREARRCGHESRELRTAILSHDNDNGRERQTDN